MSKEAFYSLLNRYLNGKCSEEEQKIIEQWYGVLDDDELPEITDAEFSAMYARFQERFNNNKSVEEGIVVTDVQQRFMPKRWPLMAVAASVTLLIVFSYFFQTPAREPAFLNEPTAEILELINTTKLAMNVYLSDSSLVVLAPESSLKYPKVFLKKNREVYLTGEAFFNVSKDKNHPFVVYSDDVITQVLGTSFNVKTNKISHRSEVQVRTGKVKVSKNIEHSLIGNVLADNNEVILLPNQRAVLPAEKASFEVSLVSNPLPLAEEDALINVNQFNFNDTPLSDVFESISKTYGISITLDDPTVGTCRFTGDLNDESLITRLEFICKSTNLKYHIQGTAVRIEGKGCSL